MAKTGVEFRMPVTLTFDDADMTALEAVEDFYRMLAEAEQAGFMDRRLIGISYGEAADQKPLVPVTGGQQPGSPAGDLTALAENLGLVPDDLDGLVHDAASQRASDINNGGLGPQVEFLAESYGAGWARSLIRNCGPDPLESVTDLRGSMIDGYDDGKVNSVLGRISDASGIRLVCVWDFLRQLRRRRQLTVLCRRSGPPARAHRGSVAMAQR
jgi:hypothetical protein